MCDIYYLGISNSDFIIYKIYEEFHNSINKKIKNVLFNIGEKTYFVLQNDIKTFISKLEGTQEYKNLNNLLKSNKSKEIIFNNVDEENEKKIEFIKYILDFSYDLFSDDNKNFLELNYIISDCIDLAK